MIHGQKNIKLFPQLFIFLALYFVTYEAFYLHVVSSLSCIPVICPELVLFLIPFAICVSVLRSVQVYPAVILIYFISAAVILLPSLALIVQVSLPCNKTGRTSALCNFILVFLWGVFVV